MCSTVQFRISSTKLQIHENYIIVLPVSILTVVVRQLLGPHDTLLHVLIYVLTGKFWMMLNLRKSSVIGSFLMISMNKCVSEINLVSAANSITNYFPDKWKMKTSCIMDPSHVL